MLGAIRSLLDRGEDTTQHREDAADLPRHDCEEWPDSVWIDVRHGEQCQYCGWRAPSADQHDQDPDRGTGIVADGGVEKILIGRGATSTSTVTAHLPDPEDPRRPRCHEHRDPDRDYRSMDPELAPDRAERCGLCDPSHASEQEHPEEELHAKLRGAATDSGHGKDIVALQKKTAREAGDPIPDGGLVTKTQEERIAADQLEMLAEKPARCAWVSVHAGRHPWVCYSADLETFLIAETGGTGRLEVDTATRSELLGLFAENPVDIKPKEAAEFSPPESGRANVWEYAAERGENVVYADERLVGGEH